MVGHASLTLASRPWSWGSLIPPISRDPSGGISDGQLQSYLKYQTVMMMKAPRRYRLASSVMHTHLAVLPCRSVTWNLEANNLAHFARALGADLQGTLLSCKEG